MEAAVAVEEVPPTSSSSYPQEDSMRWDTGCYLDCVAKFAGETVSVAKS